MQSRTRRGVLPRTFWRSVQRGAFTALENLHYATVSDWTEATYFVLLYLGTFTNLFSGKIIVHSTLFMYDSVAERHCIHSRI